MKSKQAAIAAMIFNTRRRRAIAEAAFRPLFEPDTALIGLSVAEVIYKVGPSISYGSFDFGEEVYQWTAGRLLAEVWFKNGVCITVELRSRAE